MSWGSARESRGDLELLGWERSVGGVEPSLVHHDGLERPAGGSGRVVAEHDTVGSGSDRGGASLRAAEVLPGKGGTKVHVAGLEDSNPLRVRSRARLDVDDDGLSKTPAETGHLDGRAALQLTSSAEVVASLDLHEFRDSGGGNQIHFLGESRREEEGEEECDEGLHSVVVLRC